MLQSTPRIKTLYLYNNSDRIILLPFLLVVVVCFIQKHTPCPFDKISCFFKQIQQMNSQTHIIHVDKELSSLIDFICKTSF